MSHLRADRPWMAPMHPARGIHRRRPYIAAIINPGKVPNQIHVNRLLPSRRLPTNRVHQPIYLAKHTRRVVIFHDFLTESF